MTNYAQSHGREETENYEFKRDLSSRDGIREAICALANDLGGHGGGTILIGVARDGTPHPIDIGDDNLRLVGGFRDEGKLLPRPTMTVQRARYGDHDVIAVRISPSEHPPMRLDGVAWVRSGTSSRRAHAGDERVLTERRRVLDAPFDHEPIRNATIADLDLELFRSTYLPVAVSPDVLAENERPELQQLASLRLATIDGAPTVAGMVTLGFDPTAFVLGAYLQFVRYAGPDEGSVVADHEEVRANLPDLLHDLDLRLAANITKRLQSVSGMREEDVPAYPVGALRELVVNALVHRSYSSRAPVRLLWFADRVQVSSPGGPFGEVTPDNFRQQNDYRNPTIAEAVKNLGYANRFGRGIARVEAALAQNGNPPPRYEIGPNHWSVTVEARP